MLEERHRFIVSKEMGHMAHDGPCMIRAGAKRGVSGFSMHSSYAQDFLDKCINHIAIERSCTSHLVPN